MDFAQDLKKATRAFESAMIDKMKVERYVSHFDPETRRQTEDTLEIIAENIKCFIGYSTQNNDNPNTLTDENLPIKWKPLIMCPLNTDVKAGDMITITCPFRNNAVYKGRASDINFEVTHIEFNIGIDTEA